MIIAVAFFAIMNLMVKMLPHLPAVEIIFFRSVVSFVISYVVLKAKDINVWGNNVPILMLRGAAGAIALSMYFITLQAIPLASAVTIQYLSPIFTSIIGIWFVKEKVRPLQWVFFVIAFLGTVVIQGFDTRISLLYGGLGLMSAMLSGLAYNCVRKLSTTDHPLVVIFYFPLITIPLAGAYLFFDWVTPIGWDWFYLLMVGITTQIAQLFMTKAYQAEDLSKVSSITYIGIIFALGIGYVFFKETFNIMSYLGMLIVLVGVILNIGYKQRLERVEN